jgi:putative hydrolase of the HAD superfamily
VLRAVLFDLDNTLYEYAPCNESGLQAAWEVLPPQSSWTRLEFQQIHDQVRRELASELQGQAASHNRVHFFKRVLERCGGGVDVGGTLKLYQTYWRAFLEAMRLAPGALEVVAQLRESYRLALVSNHTTEVQLRKLQTLGLQKEFAVVVTSEEAGVEKPDRRIFERTLQALQVPAGEAVMVGDDPVADIEGAIQAGLRAVQIDDFIAPARYARAVCQCGLKELPEVLRTEFRSPSG